MAARIKKDDVVYVRSGNDKGKTGKVLRFLGEGDEAKVIVEGVNMKWKHLKPTQTNQRGGRIQKEAPVHISKVQPVDPKTNKGARVKFTVTNGEKHRIAVKTGSDLGLVAKV
jgi:large subunit ribosomal protein L24